jgi:hypothetical protein
LSDAALTWYIWLDNTKIKTWKDLVDTFIRQYKFNMDVGPDRSSLQAMKKDNKESMREYTQRWRETLVHVNPSLLEKEMINFFPTLSRPRTLNIWLEALHTIFLT